MLGFKRICLDFENLRSEKSFVGRQLFMGDLVRKEQEWVSFFFLGGEGIDVLVLRLFSCWKMQGI